ncbi:unnamed protein product [Staurois parvus]|uniref:Uncharacterized protein n=1 Tax=Staurois parvus TaxID=386267 RepID=A0ABN9GZN0_9NEOB|nr:unnamed protein product [Staurois parvus]
MKGTRGISWGPLLTPGPRAVPKCSNGQSAPDCALGQCPGFQMVSLPLLATVIYSNIRAASHCT